MSRKHILVLSRSLPFHSIGGMQAVAWDLVGQFARDGFRVTVLTTAIEGRQQPFEGDGATVVPLSAAPAEKYGAAWWKASRQYVSEQLGSVDAVLSISAAAAGLLPLKSAMPDTRFVFQAHGTSLGEFVSKWRSGNPVQWAKSVKNLYWMAKDAAIYRGFDRFVLVGDVIRQQFDAWPLNWMVSGKPYEVIRNGIDTSVFRPDQISRARVREESGWVGEDKVIAYAARLHPQKGGEWALRGFAQLRQKEAKAKLLMIGDGPDRTRLEQLAQQLGLNGAVRFTGAVQREQIPALLAAGDAFVFPTVRQEGLPLNVLEALAVGLPCVVSDLTRGVFDDKLPIRYVKAEDSAAMAAQLHSAVNGRRASASLLLPDYTLALCAQRYYEQLGVA
ncbi:glycosyltransferase family 4 protein [Chitinivorax sp. PXF-14]|uniref:glycosyltransferase family 4 protein n=1 Tax=Chitinivorax sp. PXF-14 TaxID=3230488 RepID=UPI003466A9DC